MKLDWPTIVAGIISTIVAGIILKVLERTFDEGRVKRLLLVAEGVFLFTVIPWFISLGFFYTNDPEAGTQPVTAETVLEALGYIFWTGISPFGRLLMAAGLTTGLVLGIWYPEKLREMVDSLDGKQRPAAAAERPPERPAKDAADRDGSA